MEDRRGHRDIEKGKRHQGEIQPESERDPEERSLRLDSGSRKGDNRGKRERKKDTQRGGGESQRDRDTQRDKETEGQRDKERQTHMHMYMYARTCTHIHTRLHTGREEAWGTGEEKRVRGA